MTKNPPKQSAKSTKSIKATQPPQPVPEPPPLGRQGRAVGLDVHPDSFAAAILEGRDPLRARVAQSITRQPLEALCAWAQRHTRAEDVLVIEASANTFAIAERLTALGRQVFILESHRAGQIGKSYLANDRLDAAKIDSLAPARVALRAGLRPVSPAAPQPPVVPGSISAAWRSKSGSPMRRRDSGGSCSRPTSVA